MMNSLAHLLTSSQQQDRGALAEGIQSLNQGMQSWLGGMKERHQKRTIKAATQLIQQDKIPWEKLNELLADVDIDPVAMMQGLEPAMANRKRQQFQQAGPVVAGIITNALSAGNSIPMGEIITAGTQYGLGIGEIFAIIKGVQDSGLIPTIGEKLGQGKLDLAERQFGQRQTEFEAENLARERKFMSSPGIPLERGTAEGLSARTGIPPRIQPGATSQALTAHQRPQQPGMPTKPMGPGPTIPALGHKQYFTGGVPEVSKPPTSEAGIAATDFPLFEKIQKTKAKYKPSTSRKLMSYPEERARAKESREAEKRILNPQNVEVEALEVDIEFFNANTDKPYRFARKPGEVKNFWPDTSAEIEKISVEEFNKRKQQKTSAGTEESWRDYLEE